MSFDKKQSLKKKSVHFRFWHILTRRKIAELVERCFVKKRKDDKTSEINYQSHMSWSKKEKIGHPWKKHSIVELNRGIKLLLRITIIEIGKQTLPLFFTFVFFRWELTKCFLSNRTCWSSFMLNKYSQCLINNRYSFLSSRKKNFSSQCGFLIWKKTYFSS